MLLLLFCLVFSTSFCPFLGALDKATDWTTEGSEFEPRWGQEFSLLHVVETGTGVHPASYPVGTGNSFPGG
jgi:hypothetical protein